MPLFMKYDLIALNKHLILYKYDNTLYTEDPILHKQHSIVYDLLIPFQRGGVPKPYAEWFPLVARPPVNPGGERGLPYAPLWSPALSFYLIALPHPPGGYCGSAAEENGEPGGGGK